MSQQADQIATWEDESYFNIVNTGNPDGFNRSSTFNPNVRETVRNVPQFEEQKQEEDYLMQSIFQPAFHYGSKNGVLEPAWGNILYNAVVLGGVMVIVGGAAASIDLVR